VIDRRTFLAGTGAVLLASPLAAEGQQAGKVPVVGVLTSGSGPRPVIVDSSLQAFRELGYVEGQTLSFVFRASGGRPDAFPGLAADLVRQKVDLILVSGPAAIRAAKDATGVIPIVALDLESDPVQAGFVRSFAQPGGNLTGCFLDQPGLTGKWLELIGEVSRPGRLAVLVDTTTGPWQLAAVKAAAEKRRIELQIIEIGSATDLDRLLEAELKGSPRALVQLSSPLFDLPRAKRLAEFTLKHRLPAISMFRRFPEAGGLMSYGPNQVEYYKRLPTFIDKILKGAKPANLPVEQPTKFELVINLKTATALGLTIPPSLLGRADEVIQ
jgi:putative ABC transport system substrate-binding protein